jgi:hypothetical protein
MLQLVLFGITARNIPGMLRGILNLALGGIAGPTIVLVGAVSGWGPLEAWWAGALLSEYGWYLVMDVSGFRVSPGHFSERHGLIFIITLSSYSSLHMRPWSREHIGIEFGQTRPLLGAIG